MLFLSTTPSLWDVKRSLTTIYDRPKSIYLTTVKMEAWHQHLMNYCMQNRWLPTARWKISTPKCIQNVASFYIKHKAEDAQLKL